MQAKQCSVCKKIKFLNKFYNNKKSKDGLQYRCIACSEEYYIQNKKRILQNGIKFYEKNRIYKKTKREEAKKYTWEIKSKTSCKCGEKDPVCLEFHHIDPTTKNNTIAELISKGASLDLLKREIDKCQIICANCHREKHYNNIAKTLNKKVKYIRDIKQNSCCKHCKKTGIEILVFHHKNQKTKLFSLGRFKHSETTTQMIKDEINKCDILCENCHRKLHHRLRENE